MVWLAHTLKRQAIEAKVELYKATLYEAIAIK